MMTVNVIIHSLIPKISKSAKKGSFLNIFENWDRYIKMRDDEKLKMNLLQVAHNDNDDDDDDDEFDLHKWF